MCWMAWDVVDVVDVLKCIFRYVVGVCLGVGVYCWGLAFEGLDDCWFPVSYILYVYSVDDRVGVGCFGGGG
jgi:hypothetical protein